MNSDDTSRSPHRRTSLRPFRYALTTAAAAAALGIVLVGCSGQGTGTRTEEATPTSDVKHTDTKLLWVGDSIAGSQAPALGAAMKAAGVDFKDASSDGGGTVVAGGEKITQTIAGDTWKQLAGDVASFKPTVVAYQITTYDWGSREQQRAAYKKLVSTAKDAGAKAVFVSAPPIKIDAFYKAHASQMGTAPQVARDVADSSGGAAVFLDASQLWGTDAASKKALRAADGIHNCQQGAAAYAAWFAKELGKKEGFTPADVDAWGNGSWTGDDRYAKLKCDS